MPRAIRWTPLDRGRLIERLAARGGRCAVTAGVAARDHSGVAGAVPQERPGGPIRRGRLFGIRTGQLVSTQTAAVVLLAGAVSGRIAFAAAALVVVVMLAITWLRLRGRCAFEWFGTATG